MNMACFTKRLYLFPSALLLIATLGCDQRHPAPVATPPPVVMVALPVQREITDYQVFTARTQAVESVDVKARVTGYLTKVCFKDGDEVKKDQVLFEIDDRPYKAVLDQAKAAVELSQASLVKTQADYEMGQDLLKQNVGAISKQDLVKRLGARDESKASLDKAKADVESAQLNYDWCKVTSPLSGRVNRHFVDVGNLVTQDGTTLTNIVSLKPIWAYFDVDENTVRRYQQLVQKGEIKSARKNEIPVDMAMAGDTSFPLKGYIDFVSNQLDPNTGSIRVRAVFPNDDGTLVAGLFGRVRVPMSAPHLGLLVVDSAIGTDQGQRFVLVVNDQDEVEYRPVEVGQLHGGLREVMRYREVTEAGPDSKGVLKKVEVLKPTDRVIVEGLQRVRPGAKVEPKLVDMATLLVQPGLAAKKATKSK